MGERHWAVMLETQMRSWREDASWIDSSPSVTVTQPRRTCCQLDCRGLLALPPDAIFNSLCDPANNRIFKNVEGVKYRKVLRDLPSGDQEMEVEFVTRWRFLFLSGSYAMTLKVHPDRPNYKIDFELSKPGFMKQFKGSWKLEPVPVPPSALLSSSASVSTHDLVRKDISGSSPGADSPPHPLDVLSFGSSLGDWGLESPPPGSTPEQLPCDLQPRSSTLGPGESSRLGPGLASDHPRHARQQLLSHLIPETWDSVLVGQMSPKSDGGKRQGRVENLNQGSLEGGDSAVFAALSLPQLRGISGNTLGAEFRNSRRPAGTGGGEQTSWSAVIASRQGNSSPDARSHRAGVVGAPWRGVNPLNPGMRIATEVKLVQLLEPSLQPPPLFAGHMRDIAAGTLVQVFRSLQLEAARLRYGLPDNCDLERDLQRLGHLPDSKVGKEGAAGSSAAVPGSPVHDWSTDSDMRRAGNQSRSSDKQKNGRRSGRLSRKENWKGATFSS